MDLSWWRACLWCARERRGAGSRRTGRADDGVERALKLRSANRMACGTTRRASVSPRERVCRRRETRRCTVHRPPRAPATASNRQWVDASHGAWWGPRWVAHRPRRSGRHSTAQRGRGGFGSRGECSRKEGEPCFLHRPRRRGRGSRANRRAAPPASEEAPRARRRNEAPGGGARRAGPGRARLEGASTRRMPQGATSYSSKQSFRRESNSRCGASPSRRGARRALGGGARQQGVGLPVEAVQPFLVGVPERTRIRSRPRESRPVEPGDRHVARAPACRPRLWTDSGPRARR